MKASRILVHTLLFVVATLWLGCASTMSEEDKLLWEEQGEAKSRPPAK
jgi:hypothetical protein